MKYCIQCGAEYKDEVNVCSDCNEPLVTPQEFQRKRDEEKQFQEETKYLVKVFTLKDRFEADVIKSELEKEGIPVLIRSFSDTAYNGIYIPQKGWGEVRVPESKQERAREIIDALEKIFERDQVSMSEKEEDICCPYCGQEISVENEKCPHCERILGNEGDEEG